MLDHVHALARYIEDGGPVAWRTGDARGPNGEIDVCLRVMSDEYRDTAAAVGSAEAGPLAGQGAVTLNPLVVDELREHGDGFDEVG